jgi:hypothetical protein
MKGVKGISAKHILGEYKEAILPFTPLNNL